MQIAAKTALALGAIFLVLLIGGGITLSLAVAPSFERLEAESHARDRARVEANLDALARDIETRALDYAQWNDTYEFVTGRRPAYIEENFSNEWFASYGVNFLGFVDDNGRVLWAQAVIESAPQASAEDAVWQTLRTAGEGDGPQTGVIWLEGLPLIATATPVTNNEATAPGRGYLVIGRVIPTQDLRAQIQLDVRLLNRAAPPPQGLAGRLAEFYDGGAHSWTEPNRRKSLIELTDARGSMVGAVLIERARDIHALGQATMGAALMLFATFTALTFGALWVLLRRIVIARVRALEQHLRAQSTSGVDLAPLATQGSSDEIGRLTDAYNSLAARLREAITREQQALLDREAAATADRMKSDFLTNISHELRQPLDTVIGYAELVEEEMTDKGLAHVGKDAGHILDAARQLVDLVDEIYDLSLIESGRVDVSVQSFDVEKLTSEIAAKGRDLARQQGNRFELKISGALGHAFSDEIRLQQCVTNVIAYCCSQQCASHITLEAARAQEGQHEVLRFTVTTGGLSLSAAQLEQVFEPFGQSGRLAGSANKFGGPGLGLAIARKVSAMIGGRIEASNDCEQHARFDVIAPVIAPDVRAQDLHPVRRGRRAAA